MGWSRFPAPGSEAGDETRREIAGALRDPTLDERGGEPASRVDLLAMDADAALGLGEEDLDELEVGRLARGDPRHPDNLPLRFDPDLLPHLADGTVVVALTGVDVTRGAAVPLQGMGVLEMGAELQVDFADLVPDKDMNGPVEVPAGVDLPARKGGDDGVVPVDGIEGFRRRGRKPAAGMRLDPVGKLDPLPEGEFLGPNRGLQAHGRKKLLAARLFELEIVVELFAALRKAALHDRAVDLGGMRREFPGRARIEADDRGIDRGTRMEKFGADGAQGPDVPALLQHQGEDAVVLAAGLRDEAVGDFLLHHDDRLPHRAGRIEETLENGVSHGVGKVADELHRSLQKERAHVILGGIGVNDLDAKGTEFLREVLGESPVRLDEDETAALAGEVFGEGAEAGTDLDDAVPGPDLELGGDPLRQGRVDEETLAQLAARDEIKTPQQCLEFGEMHPGRWRGSHSLTRRQSKLRISCPPRHPFPSPMLLPFEDAVDFFRLHASLMNFVLRRSGRGGKRRPKDYGRLPIPQRFEIHQRFSKDPTGFLDSYLKANPDRLPAAELAEIAAWKDAVGGRLIFFRQLSKHVVVIEATTNPRVFGVLGLTQPVEEIFQRPLPVMGDCCLLPFRGAIVCDGLISSYAVQFGAGIRRGFNETYQAAKKSGRVITSFGGPPPASPKPEKQKSAARPADPLKRLVSAVRRRLSDYRAQNEVLRRFEEEAIPAFEAWVDRTFAEERAEILRLCEEIDDLEETIHRLTLDPRPVGCAAEDVDAVLASVKRERESLEDGGEPGAGSPFHAGLPEEIEDLLEESFRDFLTEMRGIDPGRMEEEAYEQAFAEFQETFRHAALGNRAAFERSLLGIGADRSDNNRKAVNAAYRRVAKRLHPDKHSKHDEETKEFWETLRNAREALDLESIERVETEWRLLREESFTKGDEAKLKRLQSQLRQDFQFLRDRRRDLETHPLWGLETTEPPKRIERQVRTELSLELGRLKVRKRLLEKRLEIPRRPETPRKKAKRTPGPKPAPPGQMEFEF